MYVPLQHFDTGTDLKSMLSDMIRQCEFDMREDTQYVADLVRIINSDVSFSRFDLDEYIKHLGEMPDKDANLQKSQIHQDERVNVESNGAYSVFRMDASARFMPWLEDRARGRKIMINTVPLRIGRTGSEAGVCIDDPSVSRSHAQIVRREGRYYITDLGSTNGTFVDGVRIGVGTMAELRDGAILSIANSNFKFHIN